MTSYRHNWTASRENVPSGLTNSVDQDQILYLRKTSKNSLKCLSFITRIIVALVSVKCTEPDQTPRQRRCGWSGSTLLAYRENTYSHVAAHTQNRNLNSVKEAFKIISIFIIFLIKYKKNCNHEKNVLIPLN